MPFVPQPDFENLLTVLRGEEPARPVLFEFIMEIGVSSPELPDLEKVPENTLPYYRALVESYYRNGYDHVALRPDFFFCFRTERREAMESLSQNESAEIWDEASLESFAWPDMEQVNFGVVEELGTLLYPGMKYVCWSSGGVFENLVDLMGFEELCYQMVDEPEFVQRVADGIGSRILRYYERMLDHDCVGAVVVNDDWGFKTQTMVAPEQLRRFVFPWHKRIVEMVHARGRPAILHSCGQMRDVWEDIIEDMKFDAKHSFEDAILPVEQAYEQLHGRIAVLGGLDVDFLCRSTPEEVYQRCAALLDRVEGRGGYALGSGNSIAPYIPRESFLAMTRAAQDRY